MKHIPICDICWERPARYDCKTVHGYWAYCCEDCYKRVGSKTQGLFTDLMKGKGER